MRGPEFVHLHTHTEYSLLDGAARIGDLVQRARDLGMDALAITDHGVMYGVIPFYKACREHGLKPIIGCEVYVAPRTRHDRTPKVDDSLHHLVLLAENQNGYRNLVRMVSEASLEGFYYKPRVDRELLHRYHEGLIALSACPVGEISSRLARQDPGGARRVAAELQEIFGPGNFFVELQDHGVPEEKELNRQLVRLAGELGLPLVATNDCHYVHQDDAEAHDVLLCIQTGKSVHDEGRLRFPNDQFYLKGPEEMAALFAAWPEALENTVRLARRCQVNLDFEGIHLPHYDIPEGYDAPSYLRKVCMERLHRRYPAPGDDVVTRLSYELDIIDRMGYAGYFLIVWDFIEYARREGIQVGPGRGSAAGSLVAYVLGITDIDPLAYGLLFERFLNPERVTMPDMDIDFCFERRNEVVDYVVRRYGQDCVAQIITFGTMAARAAIRDVGRALALPYGQVDRIAKLVPLQPGMSITRALEMEAELGRMVEEEPAVGRLLELARRLEGLPRHASVHAAGVVISREPLVEYVPLQKTSDGAVVTQFTMDILEQMGLLKMDFLGLRTLTVLRDAVNGIKQTSGVHIDLACLPRDDAATYDLLSRGDTLGVFQLESGWVREVLRDLRPSRFEDLIAAVALVRPGPMEHIPEFIRNKAGRPQYPHPLLESVLRETYGVMIYQEQVMQAVSAVAGFSLGQADILRRGMGKKKPELMAAMKEKLLKGARERGVDEKTAGEIFQLIDRFAGYGFNKSHAAAYALVAYQTAYLKAHHAREYMAALLTSVMGATDKVALYVDDCRRRGIDILPPDVNESEAEFTVVGNAIRFGLAAVKNVGRAAIDAIVAARREGGPFVSLVDFCERVDTRLLNKRAIESLIKAGAFSSLGAKRSQLLAVLDTALEQAQEAHRRRQNGQVSFFDLAPDRVRFAAATGESLPAMEEFPRARLLAMEKEVLGLYLTGHPLAHFAGDLRRQTTSTVAELREMTDGSPVTVGGLVSSLKKVITRHGQPMLFVGMEDLTGNVEVIVFPRTYERCRDNVQEDAVVVVKGRLSQQEEEVRVIADEVTPLARKNKVYIKIGREAGERRLLAELKAILANHSGTSPVYLYLEQERKVLLTDREYWVDASPELLVGVERLLGPGTIKIEG